MIRAEHDEITQSLQSARTYFIGMIGSKRTIKMSQTKTPFSAFRDAHYVRHNARRMEHLASLGLPISGRTVLELGAGIGDLSTFFLDRNCRVTITEGRQENLEEIQSTLKCDEDWRPGEHYSVHKVDLENPSGFNPEKHDIIFNYGLLYHLSNPQSLLHWASRYCTDFMVCETCVSYQADTSDGVNNVSENDQSPTQAISGVGNRPSRELIFEWMSECFSHVYLPKTQPRHPQFPTDWTMPAAPSHLSRAIFIGSNSPLKDETPFIKSVPAHQEVSV